jgi:tetratricopeptide (TPR) repeat protein
MPMPHAEERQVVARALRHLAAKALEEAEAEVADGLARCPGSAGLLALAAELKRKRKRLAEAEALLRRARAADPFHQLVVQVGAELAFDRGDYRSAAAGYRQALDRKPSSYLGARLVLALVRLGELDRAVEEARQGLERHPDDPWILGGLAAAEARRGRRQEAAVLYETLVRLRPDDRFAYKELMRLRTAEAPPEEAAAALQGLVRTGRRRKDPHLRTLAGDRLRDAGRLAEAADEYRVAVELDPGHRYALAQLGFCYRRLGDRDRAIEVLSRAFLADPANPYVRTSLESLCREGGEPGRMLSLVDEALSLHPEVKALHGVRRRAARLVEAGARDVLTAGRRPPQRKE